MKRFLITSASLLLSTGIAYAAEPMANMIGNTLVEAYPDGAVQKIWVKGNHTYSAVDRKGMKIAGVWWMENNEFCHVHTAPTETPKHCEVPFAEKKIGDTWEVTETNGEKVKFTLVAGS